MELISEEKGKFLGLLNYARVLGSPWFWQALGRTLYFTLRFPRRWRPSWDCSLRSC